MFGRLKRYVRLTNFEYTIGLAKAMFISSGKMARFRVAGHPIRLRPKSFIAQYRDIFLEHEYAFQRNNDTPRILDIGANVGMSCLYFRRMYPGSSIDAFEADPEIYRALKENLEKSGHGDINIINRAVWTEEATLRFNPNGLGGGSLTDKSGLTNSIAVQSIDLKEWLQGKDYDLKKWILKALNRMFYRIV